MKKKSIRLLLALLSLLSFWACGQIPQEEGNEQKPGEEQKPEEKPGEKPEDGPQSKAETLTLLFTNDFHSQIEPIDENASYNANRGGISRIKVLTDSVRAADKAVLLCDAGDFVQGSYYFTCFNGEVEMMVQKELGYDIKTIGNHEFDKKMNGLEFMLRYNDIPIVSSNYDFNSTSLSDRVLKSYMIEVEGRKIGFIGLNTRLSGLVDPNASEGVKFEQAIDNADKYAQSLKEQGADLVVALSHLGYNKDSDASYYDRGIAMKTKHLDCIIGGHSHTFLTTADYVNNLEGKKVPIVQTGSKGIYLGEMKVKFSDNGPSFSYRLIPVNSRLDSRLDGAFQSKIDYYAAILEEAMNEVLAYCPTTLRKGSPQGLLSNFTADALYNICTDYFQTEPDLAIYNNGGIRAELPAGDVTRGTIYSIYPFDNVLTLIEIKGSYLLDAFNGIAAYGGEPVSASVNLMIKDKSVYSLKIKGEDIQPDKTYKLATINYLIDATNYLGALRNYSSRRESGAYVYELFSDYVKKLGDAGQQISSQFDDRVTILD